jgi:hypothetical protein
MIASKENHQEFLFEIGQAVAVSICGGKLKVGSSSSNFQCK